MDADFYKSILEENKEAVKQKVKEAMLESVHRQFQWELPAAIKKEVELFIQEEIAPSIRTTLMGNKDEIVNAATAIIVGIPVELGKALQADLAKRFTDSWKLKKVTSALFD